MRWARGVAAAVVVTALVPSIAGAMPLCDSMEQRNAFYKSMEPWKKALEQKRFADVDRHYNALIADTAAGKMTDQELQRWFGNFSQSNSGRAPLHEDWIREYPNSAAARLALVYYYIERGWNARGGEYVSKTSEAQFQAMGEEFAKAFRALPAAEALMARPTLPATLRITMLASTGDPEGKRKLDIYRSAIRSFPESVQLRVLWVMYSAPKWGGSIDKIKDVLDDTKPLSKEDRRYIEYMVDEELGSTYRDAEDYKRAAEYYNKAIPLCPGLEGALTKAMKMYQARKDFEALVPAATIYIERFPRDGWGYAMRGWAHLSRKEMEQAARDYEQGAQLGSSFAREGLEKIRKGTETKTK